MKFLQASDDSFRLRLLELDRNYDILTYCLQNNRSTPELIQHIIFCGFQSIFLPFTGKNRTSFTTSITLNASVHRERLIEWDLHPNIPVCYRIEAIYVFALEMCGLSALRLFVLVTPICFI